MRGRQLGLKAGAAWLPAGRTRLLALAGRDAEALDALGLLRGLSEQVILTCPSRDQGLPILEWSQVRLHHTETVVYTLLDDARRAEAARGEALGLYPEECCRDRAEVLLYQALGLARQRDAVGGASLARRVLANLPATQRTATVRETGRLVLDSVPQAECRRPAVSGLRDLVSPTDG